MHSNPVTQSLLLILSSAILLLGHLNAGVSDYATTFTSSESPPFTDASLTAQNGWFSQGLGAVSDAAGTGLVTLGNTERAIHGDSGGSFAIGETITLSISLKFLPEVTPNAVWRLGLTETTSVGAGDPRAGAEVRRNRTDLPDQVMQLRDHLGGQTVNTTIASNNTGFHTLTTSITKTATTNVFDVVSTFEGTVSSHTLTNSVLYEAENVYPVFQQRGGAALGFVDSFSISSSTAASGDQVTITNTSYDPELGLIIQYSTEGTAVDIYRNKTGGLAPENFSLLLSAQTGGRFVDPTADPNIDSKAFYTIVPSGTPPFK